MPVTGIGGLFFRTRDPAALAAWYLEHLGVGGVYGQWEQAAGPTVFAPFAETSDYFPREKQWMLNLRVDGLDDLVTRLEASGIAVERRAEWDEAGIGRFGRLHDPEGNAVELWEPASD